MTQQERVTAGIAWLDANPLVPSDWREHVRPDSLSIVSPQACLLAQLAEAYEWPTPYFTAWGNALAYLWPNGRPDDEALRDLGFLRSWAEYVVDDDTTLTAAWREALSTTPAV